MDREAWRAAIHGVTKSQTWLSEGTELNWTEYSVRAILGLWFGFTIFIDVQLIYKTAHVYDIQYHKLWNVYTL